MSRRAASATVLAVVVAWLCAASVPAEAQALTVERCRARGDSVDLQVRFDIKAPPATVWSVLTDYNRQSRFIPGLVRSRRLTNTKEGPVVEQVGEVRTLMIGKRVSALLQMRELPPHRLGFRALTGSFARLRGMWLLKPLPGGRTRLYYRCTVGARPPVPDAMLAWAVRQELTPRARGIGQEAERRVRVKRRS